MWGFTSAAHHKLLLVLCRRLHKPGSSLRVGSQIAAHHLTAALMHPEDSSSDPTVTKRHRQKPGANYGWRDNERSAQGKMGKTDVSGKQRTNHRKAGEVSTELRKLCLDDSPAERERPVTQRSTPESRQQSHEILFGLAPCLLALKQGRRKARKLFVKDGESSHRASVLKVCEEAFRQGVQVQRVSKRDLDRMSSERVHQGVCLQASPLSYIPGEKDTAPSRKDSPLWLVLEGIQDPMNLGAILRSAYFLGVDRVVSSLRQSCPLSPVVSKASSGAMEVLRVYGYDNLEAMLKSKVAMGWQAVGTVAADADSSLIPVTQCSDFRMTKPTLLLIGSEGEGLSQELISLCQTWLTIPAGRALFPGIESLNVSVATGILLHSLLLSRSSNR